jgi:hypothetical protein
MLNSYPYQVSIQNILAQGPSLGYSTNGLVCLCKNTNLAYGTRDFADASCNSAADAAATITYCILLCSLWNPPRSFTRRSRWRILPIDEQLLEFYDEPTQYLLEVYCSKPNSLASNGSRWLCAKNRPPRPPAPRPLSPGDP